ncbi:MAG TPA: response regulator transcription factor [Desulfobacteria bacterium]|nr:response regulator transcription factor [Desulfobacteria bacterium]
MPKVLLVEDDVSIQQLLNFNLEKEGFEVLVAGDGLTGLKLVGAVHPDVILLDLMLPELDGLEVCKAIRSQEELKNIPIIMLSARDDVVDKVIGLELGADDYVVKPFSPKEVTARIKARLRERERVCSTAGAQANVEVGELTICPDNYLVTQAGTPVSLTVKEFELLHILVAHPNQVFSREHLLQQVWGYDSTWDTRTVDVHISNLRQKLTTASKKIETVRGIGYRFTVIDRK